MDYTFPTPSHHSLTNPPSGRTIGATSKFGIAQDVFYHFGERVNVNLPTEVGFDISVAVLYMNLAGLMGIMNIGKQEVEQFAFITMANTVAENVKTFDHALKTLT